MEMKLRTSALTVVLVFTLVGVSFAQAWNLPDSRRNTRFTTDLHDIVRPALTIRGFDNTDLPTHYNTFDHSKVYGVKQVLERAYEIGTPQIDNIGIVLDQMILEVTSSTMHYSGLDKEKVEDNASLAKTMAALALFTYIIEKNDGDPGEPNIFDSGKKALFPDMPSHADALADLMAFLTSAPSTLMHSDHTDPFKSARSAMNLAQMWDMYLALENAYQDLDGNTITDQKLLNSSQKSAWNQRMYDFINEIYSYSFSSEMLFDQLGNFVNVNKHEVQPGNWALISFVASGYLTLGFNGTFSSSTSHFLTERDGSRLRHTM
jgi:hypothetical protein